MKMRMTNLLNKTHPLYPEYAATKTQIKAKQSETIDVFAEAVKLNKLAQEKKDEEAAVRKEATRMKNQNRKMSSLTKRMN